MANVEWDIAFQLKSPAGTLALGSTSGDRYVFVKEKCSMKVAQLRLNEEPVPQGDGWTHHDNWTTGYETKLAVQYWIGDDVPSSVPACGNDRVRMHDTLMQHLSALVRPSLADLDGGNTQLIWTPSQPGSGSLDDRMLNRIWLADLSEPFDDGAAVEVAFALHSVFPYAMDKTELTTSEPSGIFTINNPGTTTFYPVFKVHGEFDSFQLANNTTGEDIEYIGPTVVPGGSYAELDTFRCTIFENGNGANLAAGIDGEVTDFWGLVPGDNEIEFIGVGVTVDILHQAAWF